MPVESPPRKPNSLQVKLDKPKGCLCFGFEMRSATVSSWSEREFLLTPATLTVNSPGFSQQLHQQ